MVERLNPFWLWDRLVDRVALAAEARINKVLRKMEFHVDITRLGDTDHRLIGEHGALGEKVPLRFTVVPHEIVEQVKANRQ